MSAKGRLVKTLHRPRCSATAAAAVVVKKNDNLTKKDSNRNQNLSSSKETASVQTKKKVAGSVLHPRLQMHTKRVVAKPAEPLHSNASKTIVKKKSPIAPNAVQSTVQKKARSGMGKKNGDTSTTASNIIPSTRNVKDCDESKTSSDLNEKLKEDVNQLASNGLPAAVSTESKLTSTSTDAGGNITMASDQLKNDNAVVPLSSSVTNTLNPIQHFGSLIDLLPNSEFSTALAHKQPATTEDPKNIFQRMTTLPKRYPSCGYASASDIKSNVVSGRHYKEQMVEKFSATSAQARQATKIQNDLVGSSRLSNDTTGSCETQWEVHNSISRNVIKLTIETDEINGYETAMDKACQLAAALAKPHLNSGSDQMALDPLSLFAIDVATTSSLEHYDF